MECNGYGVQQFKRERLEAAAEDPACEGNLANATMAAGCHQVDIQNAGYH